MPRTKPAFSGSYDRRLARVASLGIGSLDMRVCWNCSRSSKPCRVAKGVEKCVECVRTGRPCDLAPLNTARWRRLEDQCQKLKSELREAYTRQQRLLRQIDFVEEEQRVMVDGELQNLESLQAEEAPSPGLLPDPFIDVTSKQIVFPNASEG